MGLPFGLTPGDIIELVALLGAGLGVVWSVRYEVRIMKHDIQGVAQRQEALESQIRNLDNSMVNQFDRVERELGETIAAMREKVTQVELYMRDNFVRKETFHITLAELKGSILRIEDKMGGKRGP